MPAGSARCGLLGAIGWLVGALVAGSAAAQAQLDRALFIQKSASLFQVEARNSNGSFSLGTAVAVAPGVFVTNCHVTRDSRFVSLVKGTVRWPVAAQFADLRHDLCLLRVPSLNAPAVEIRSASDLKVGQRVAAMGFAGGLKMSLREGVVRALHRLDNGNVIQSSTVFTGGASGGGLFDDQGRLVGILTFRLPGAQAYYFSAPVDWIEAPLRKTGHYAKVAPLGKWTPFWQEPVSRLPYFMQAALLEADAQWQELLKLADDWALADAASPEPWVFRGKAYTRLDRTAGAAKAFEQAVALEPGLAEAWFNLGVTYFHLGDAAALRRAFSRLRELDTELADDLAVVSGLARN